MADSMTLVSAGGDVTCGAIGNVRREIHEYEDCAQDIQHTCTLLALFACRQLRTDRA